MSDTRHTKLLIIGSGPAGYTAAVYASRAMLEPILVQGIEPGGQLTITTEVENWPGDPAVMGPDLMVRMEAHAKAVRHRVDRPIIITELDLSARPFTATGDSGTTYLADAVILATGARAKWLGLPSEDKFKGFGVSACATCDGFFYRGQEIAVIGGGNTAVEEALFLTNFASKVTLVHRRDTLRAEKILQDRLFKNDKIETLWFHELDEVVGTDTPKGVEGIRVKNVQTGEISELPCQGRVCRHRTRTRQRAGQGSARDAHGRLCRDQARLDRNRDSGGLCRRRHYRLEIPPGGHERGHGLHGGAGSGTLSGRTGLIPRPLHQIEPFPPRCSVGRPWSGRPRRSAAPVCWHRRGRTRADFRRPIRAKFTQLREFRRIKAGLATWSGSKRAATRRDRRPALINERFDMTMLSNLAPIPELYVSYDSAQKLKVEAGNLKSWDLSPAPDLRSGAFDEWWLQPAEGVPERGRLQRRGRNHAHCRRHAVADADHAGCQPRPSPTAWRWAGHRAARSRKA
jgi:thioredoxin reductase (NADPH)